MLRAADIQKNVSSPQNASAATFASDQARKRNNQRDVLLRKKIDMELSRKTTPRSARRQAKMSTVNTLNVSPAITAQETCTVFEVAQIMAAKRADSVLVVDEDLALSGIFTDKDLAYRVIAEGLDVRTTLVSSIMTKSPKCVAENTSATTALHTMVSGGFRHLPVVSEASGEILGILDIAKCLREAMEKMERAFGTSKMLSEALSGIEKEWSVHTEEINRCVDFLKDRMGCPDLSTLLDNPAQVPQMNGRSNVKDAAKMMKGTHETAVLITDQGRVTGIFTSKDIVLRVVAVGFDPNTTSLFRVMTPHPDCVSTEVSIIEALRKMHDGRYLHLPVVDFENQVAGMVNVLQLTFSTLEQLNVIQGKSEGPMWDRFWNSALEGPVAENFDNVSISASQRSEKYEADSLLEAKSLQTAATTYVPGQGFTYKVHSQWGVHRIRTTGDSLVEMLDLLRKVCEVKSEEELGKVYYRDDEGDRVVISTDDDLSDAIQYALAKGLKYVRLEMALENSEKESHSGLFGVHIKLEYAIAAMAVVGLAYHFLRK